MGRNASILLVLVLAAATAAPAQATPWADLRVASVETGPSQATASLVLLTQEAPLATDEAGSPDFILQAERLHVETDHADLYASSQTFTQYVDPRTTPEDHHDAAVAGLTHRDQYRFVVTPIENGAWAFSRDEACAAIGPSGQNEQSRESHVKQRPPFVVATQDAVTWAGCDQSHLTIEGDFLLQLWEWDAELTTAGQRVVLRSGHDPAADDPSGLAPMAGSADEQYLYAYNASLTIPDLTGSYHLYVRDAQVQAAAISLHGASGLLGSVDLEVHNQEVRMEGDLRLDLTGTDVDAPLRASVAGDVDRLMVDSESVPLASTTAAGTPTAWLWLLPLPALVPAWVAQRRVRAKRHLERAKRLARLRPKQAVEELDRAIALQPRWGVAYYERAMLWTRMRRMRQALADHEAAHAHLPASQEELRDRNAREAYRSCARLGDVPSLMEWQTRFRFRRLPISVRR